MMSKAPRWPETLVKTNTATQKKGGKELKRSVPDVSHSSLPRYRQLKSFECRGAEASAIPDLLNFKKGWMMRQDASGQWQKHWFVLTDQILRFYRDSGAEEAADVDGEINLSTCFDITEYPAQRDCGFQIHTRDSVYTLCAMTSGMRRNWVQAVLKNVRPSLTPDVTRSVEWF
ncbi:myosin phosphatase Rho-interacting protein-like [Lates calcarifer]|uniref:Myosin phosphatase Rho-interacting protein-like n=1 Tax=Lates calcarifer TaxID=8187 RepID=A0AAJ8DSN1_LATCA|nr:myosin phosphatase Rho-interacting protein-like [Lates calcarifer]